MRKQSEKKTLRLHKETIQPLVDRQQLQQVLGGGAVRGDASFDPSGCSATTLECCQ